MTSRAACTASWLLVLLDVKSRFSAVSWKSDDPNITQTTPTSSCDIWHVTCQDIFEQARHQGYSSHCGTFNRGSKWWKYWANSGEAKAHDLRRAKLKSNTWYESESTCKTPTETLVSCCGCEFISGHTKRKRMKFISKHIRKPSILPTHSQSEKWCAEKSKY